MSAAAKPAVTPARQRNRERFDPADLAAVLRQYRLGRLRSAREFFRGSRGSPKLLVETKAEKRYLLKRRAIGRDDPLRVALTQKLQQHLRQQGLPVPRLLVARDGATAVEHAGRTYELFEYLDGERFDASPAQAHSAGEMLARLHRAAADFQAEWDFPTGIYHDADAIRNDLESIPGTVSSHDSVAGREHDLLNLIRELYVAYDEAADAVRALGFDNWSATVIHADWHPGNVLFSDDQVIAVLDLDSARRYPAVLDLANGLLQFSILRGQATPASWPAFFDERRWKHFLDGYLTAAGDMPTDQLRAIPALMTAALIAECVQPIAATGSFGHLPGLGVLEMAQRKVRWLQEARSRMLEYLAPV